MKITNIKEQKHSKDRVSVFVDNKFSFGISKNDLLALKLHENDEISNKDIEKIKEEIILDNAKQKAYNYLSYKARTKSEMITKLITYEFTDDIIEITINFLEKYNYINDEDYTKLFIKNAKNSKRLGIYRIKSELKQKGIASDIIDAHLNDFNADADIIKGLVVKKLKGKTEIDFKEKKKIYDHLYRKGFTYDEISEAFTDLGVEVTAEYEN